MATVVLPYCVMDYLDRRAYKNKGVHQRRGRATSHHPSWAAFDWQVGSTVSAHKQGAPVHVNDDNNDNNAK